jgi:hypothetical protein
MRRTDLLPRTLGSTSPCRARELVDEYRHALLLSVGRDAAAAGGSDQPGTIAIGTRYLLAPQASAPTFGLPGRPHGDAGAWLYLKGTRDLASWLVILIPLARGQSHVLGRLLRVDHPVR